MLTNLPSTLAPVFVPMTRQTPAPRPHFVEPPDPPDFFDKGGDGDGDDDDAPVPPTVKHFTMIPPGMTMAQYREELRRGGVRLPKRMVKRTNDALVRIEAAIGWLGDYYDMDLRPWFVSEWEEDEDGDSEVREKRIPTMQEAFRVKIDFCDNALTNIEFDARAGNTYDQVAAGLRGIAAKLLEKATLVDALRR